MRICNTNDRSLTQLNVCYEFVDAMFTRKLFLLISWAGGSKSSITKTPFREFSHTIELFTSLVREIHPDFADSSCQHFFKKQVISNSTKRAEKPPQRVSRTKTRKKKEIANVTVDSGNSEDDGCSEDLYETPSDGKTKIDAIKVVTSTEIKTEAGDPLLVPLLVKEAVPGPSSKGAETKSSFVDITTAAKRKAELTSGLTEKKGKRTQHI